MLMKALTLDRDRRRGGGGGGDGGGDGGDGRRVSDVKTRAEAARGLTE